MTNLEHIREKITSADIAYMLKKTQCDDAKTCITCALRDACCKYVDENCSKEAVIRWLEEEHEEEQ